MKKLITALLVFTALITSAASVSTLDTALNPDIPRYGDNVTVTSYIDGEDRDLNSVEVTVRQNNSLIVEEEPMDYVGGSEQDISVWQVEDAFEVPENNQSVYEYKITVQAIDVQGEESSKTLNMEVRPEETVLQPVNTDSEVFGFKLGDIMMLGFILALFILILKD